MDILSDKVVTTRKKHRCNACSRIFEPGTRMRTQVNTGDGLVTWRECPTCIALLSTHRKYFEDCDGITWEECVSNLLRKGQTPEQLLDELNREATFK